MISLGVSGVHRRPNRSPGQYRSIDPFSIDFYSTLILFCRKRFKSVCLRHATAAAEYFNWEISAHVCFTGATFKSCNCRGAQALSSCQRLWSLSSRSCAMCTDPHGSSFVGSFFCSHTLDGAFGRVCTASYFAPGKHR